MSEDNGNEKKLKKTQVTMHRDFFDRARIAIDNGFYLEAIFLEYAAIEGRLEIILGILGYPCNKEQSSSIRRRVNISDRIECLRVCKNNNPTIFERTKLTENFFTQKGKLRRWVDDRNQYIHGLFKNAYTYNERKQNFKKLAENGLEYSRLLYNEVKRLRRLLNNHPDFFNNIILKCQNEECAAVKHLNTCKEDAK